MATGKNNPEPLAPPAARVCGLEPAPDIAYRSYVLLFKSILKFKKEGGLSDKRGAKRYPIGPKFPLKAKVTLLGHDGEGRPLPPGHASSMDWGGQLSNLSGTGASIKLHPAAVANKGEDCRLKLELDDKLFEIDGVIVQFWSNQQFATCGIMLKFPNFQSQKAYLQLLEPLAIGCGLEAVERVKQDTKGLIKEQYLGEDETVFSVWRSEDSKAIEHFEMLMLDYCVRGSAQTPGLQIGYRDGAKVGRKVANPAMPINLGAGQMAEVRQLFEWVVHNFSKAVPADVRAFVERFFS